MSSGLPPPPPSLRNALSRTNRSGSIGCGYDMESARSFFNELNQHYLQLHRAEGDLYWSTHTGQSDQHEALAAASLSRKMFVADAARLAQCREHLATLHAAVPCPERDALIGGLRGWVHVFEA